MKLKIRANNRRWPEDRFPRHELPHAGPVYFVIAMMMIFAFSGALALVFTGGDPFFTALAAIVITWSCARTWFRTNKSPRYDPDDDADLSNDSMIC